MSDNEGKARKSLTKPIAASIIGAAVVAPVPFFAGMPERIPAGLFGRLAGAPILAWLMIGLMFSLVLVVLATISFVGSSGD